MTSKELIVAVMIATAAEADVAGAQTEMANGQPEFRFEVAEDGGFRGPGVQGFVYNDLPWRITNVRLRVDSVDTSGAVTESTWGWVQGDVRAGGRGYFYVRVPSLASRHRTSVQSFDKVTLDGSAVEAP